MNVNREEQNDVMIKEDKTVVEEEEEIFDRKDIDETDQSLESCIGSHIVDSDMTMLADDESVSKVRNLFTFPPPLPPDNSQKVDLPAKPKETPVLMEERSNTTEKNGEEPIPITEQLLPQKCQICGQDSMNNTRSMVRFLPTASSKSDITLHVFCGKIASILPQIAQPNLEILLTAGLKNKHGIGPYVNFALARTRSAVAVGGEAEKDPRRLDKQYYLVQEFEENLKSISGLQLNRKGIVTSIPAQVHSSCKPKVRQASKKIAVFKGRSSQQKKGKQHVNLNKVAYKPPSRQAKPLKVGSLEGPKSCTILHPSSTTPAHIDLTSTNSTSHLSSLKKNKEITTIRVSKGQSSHTRIRCPCGGSYKGPARLKAHLKTPRHVLWESLNASARNNTILDRNLAFNVPLEQQSSSRKLQQTSANRLQQTSVLGPQQANFLGLEQANSFGLQRANSLGLQHVNSLGLQQANSPGLQQANSLGLQQANSLGLKEANSILLQQALQNQGNLSLVQLRTMLEQEGNRSLLQSRSDDNPRINKIPHMENNASQVNDMDELHRQLNSASQMNNMDELRHQLNNASQVNNMDELRRQLAKAVLQGSNVGARQETTKMETNSQSLSPSILVLLLLLSQKN